MKCGFFSKFGRIIKSALFKVRSLHHLLYIFPIFWAICEYHAGKNHPLLLRSIHRAIFPYLRTNQSSAQQVRDPSVQTSGSWKEPSPVTKPHEVERHSWALPTSCKLGLLYVMKNCHEEK